MNRVFVRLLMLGAVLVIAGCSTVRVKLSGDPGVKYQAAWTTSEAGTQTRSGTVPASFKFENDVTGWFKNSTGTGRFRVRVYEGMGLLVDQALDNSARRIVIERKGRGVSYRVD